MYSQGVRGSYRAGASDSTCLMRSLSGLLVIHELCILPLVVNYQHWVGSQEG
jgi:hypothetical protein